MKKNYEKPMIFFESFSLSTNIAGDCENIIDNVGRSNCSVPGSAPGLDMFMSSYTGCFIKNDSTDAIYNGFCYHVPTEGNNLFNS